MLRLAAIILTIVTGLLAAVAPAQAQTAPTGRQINLAGELRMLSQRIAKLYCQIGLNVLPGPAIGQLSVATVKFDTSLAVLEPELDGSANAMVAHQRLTDEWLRLKAAVAVAVSLEAAQALTRQAEATLAAAEHLTSVLEDDSKFAANRVINLAGRQRMLSQRIAANFLLRSWGVESAAVSRNLDSSVNDFSAGLSRLRARPDNGADINQELDEVAQQWEWLQASMAVDGAAAYPLIVAESADAILEATDRITSLYEQQARAQLGR